MKQKIFWVTTSYEKKCFKVEVEWASYSPDLNPRFLPLGVPQGYHIPGQPAHHCLHWRKLFQRRFNRSHGRNVLGLWTTLHVAFNWAFNYTVNRFETRWLETLLTFNECNFHFSTIRGLWFELNHFVSKIVKYLVYIIGQKWPVLKNHLFFACVYLTKMKLTVTKYRWLSLCYII